MVEEEKTITLTPTQQEAANGKQIHIYHLWIPKSIYEKLHEIQEEKGMAEHNINTQIIRILAKHFF